MHFLVPFDGGRCCVVCFLFKMSYLFWGVEIHGKRKNKYKKVLKPLRFQDLFLVEIIGIEPMTS